MGTGEAVVSCSHGACFKAWGIPNVPWSSLLRLLAGGPAPSHCPLDVLHTTAYYCGAGALSNMPSAWRGRGWSVAGELWDWAGGCMAEGAPPCRVPWCSEGLCNARRTPGAGPKPTPAPQLCPTDDHVRNVNLADSRTCTSCVPRPPPPQACPPASCPTWCWRLRRRWRGGATGAAYSRARTTRSGGTRGTHVHAALAPVSLTDRSRICTACCAAAALVVFCSASTQRGLWYRKLSPPHTHIGYGSPGRYLDLFETPRLNNMTLCKYYMQTSGKGGSSGSRGASGSGAAGGGGAAGPGDKAGGAGRPVSREAGGSVGRGRPGSGKDWRPGG